MVGGEPVGGGGGRGGEHGRSGHGGVSPRLLRRASGPVAVLLRVPQYVLSGICGFVRGECV